ncbi:MAG: mechanosensitive ion channel [Ruminococcus sp.]|nr:mechanosensitive ion channel [Ruminococcus sp.]
MYEKIISLLKTYGPLLAAALLILVCGIIATKIVVKIVSKALGRSKIDKTAHSFLLSVIRISLYVLVIIMTLTKLNVPMTSIIAVLSAAGLAVSLALKENLSNVAGGFILMFTRPFKIGDYISVDNEQGFVNDIQIMYTKLLSMDNKAILIPNAKVTNTTIVNFTNEEKRRLEYRFSISYKADFNKAKAVILGILHNDERTLNYPNEPMIVMSAHNESSIEILLRVWIRQSDYWPYLYDLIREVKQGFDANGVEIPYNQLDVHIDGSIEQPAQKKNP